MELLEKLGIDWRLLIAQIVNFLILAIVLTKVAYKPIVRLLEKRSTTIAKSLDDAKRIEQELAETTKRREAELKKAEQRSAAMLAEAHLAAEKTRQELLAKAKSDVNALLGKARADAEAMQAAVVDEAKAQLADLVIDATERILKQKLDDRSDHALVERAVKDARQ